MPRKLDPIIAEALKAHGLGPDACWDCHGTWVVYHRALEQIAAKAGIVFEPPMVLEANGPAKSAALCVTGTLGDKREWSIGEAAPGNNKNTYPYAMAEKRAKDRVVLKLIGLHGLAYSEEEADAFTAQAPAAAPSNADLDETVARADLIDRIAKCATPIALDALSKDPDFVAGVKGLSPAGRNAIRAAGERRREEVGERLKPSSLKHGTQTLIDAG